MGLDWEQIKLRYGGGAQVPTVAGGKTLDVTRADDEAVYIRGGRLWTAALERVPSSSSRSCSSGASSAAARSPSSTSTMEERIRVDEDGRVAFALATDARWPDGTTLELDVRGGVSFQDGEPSTAHSIKQNFDEMQRWAAPTRPAPGSTSRRNRWRGDRRPEDPVQVCARRPGRRQDARLPHREQGVLARGPGRAQLRLLKFGSGEGHW